MKPSARPAGRQRLLAWLPTLVAALLLAMAIGVLHQALRHLDVRQLRAALADVTPGHWLLAALFTAANFAALCGYDRLGLASLGRRLPPWRVAIVSILSFALSNSVGFAWLSGASVRHRFYSRWDLSTADVARLVVMNATTYWLGLLALGGWSLVFYPLALAQGSMALWAQGAVRGLGVLMVAAVLGYVVLCVRRRATWRIRGFEFSLPGPRIAVLQVLVSIAEWLLAAAVLHTLLPPDGPGFLVLLSAFVAAQWLGLVSHVPGGLGVFEGAMLVLLAGTLPAEQLVAALLVYRLTYYLLPLVLALVALMVDEARQQRQQIARLARAGRWLGGISVALAPRLLAVFTFLAGVLLLVSGATPAIPERLHLLARVLPVHLLEVSHFLGSLVGVALLLLAQAISRRLRVAYYLGVVLLMAGIATALLKAADWEEALLLALLLGLFVSGRPFFDRKAALFDTRFSPGWVLAIVAALGASVWLGVFAYRHVEYSSALWWQLLLNQDAPRFLRASLGAAVMLLAFAAWHLLRPPQPVAPQPTVEDLADAQRITQAQSETLPLLAMLGDKALFFNAERTAFLMYAVQGRTWAVLGDPVGPVEAAAPLVRAFVDRANDQAGVPVFYQAQARHLHLYADLGMAFAKLGEEAQVPLADFTLAGPQQRDLRSAMNRLAREGVGFRVVAAADVPPLLPQLKAVSDDWLQHKAVGEKGYSVGWFEPQYLASGRVAVLEGEGRMLAFANLLETADHTELSVDLMRFSKAAPHGAMDGLFAQLLQWGQAQGYQHFNLGMAPLSGLKASPFGAWWARVGCLVYRHGEPFYNFEGLRAYKQKFRPQWAARYLAYPGGSALALRLADIAALSAGGYLRVFR